MVTVSNIHKKSPCSTTFAKTSPIVHFWWLIIILQKTVSEDTWYRSQHKLWIYLFVQFVFQRLREKMKGRIRVTHSSTLEKTVVVVVVQHLIVSGIFLLPHLLHLLLGVCNIVCSFLLLGVCTLPGIALCPSVCFIIICITCWMRHVLIIRLLVEILFHWAIVVWSTLHLWVVWGCIIELIVSCVWYSLFLVGLFFYCL